MAVPADGLKADRFLAAIEDYFRAWQGTYLYDICLGDHREKVLNAPDGYPPWLERLGAYLSRQYRLPGMRVLDVGCGAGELTVWMNRIGFEATGLDVHQQFLNMGRVLAVDNGLSEGTFVHMEGDRIPFPDRSFDVVTLFSVLEHLSDDVLATLLPEIHRVCRGVVYVLVPNRYKPTDDHTGLHFVPWMPRWLAENYLRMRGKKYQYYISLSGEWDVYYRSLSAIRRLTQTRFTIEFPPDDVIYPPLDHTPILGVRKQVRVGSRTFRLGVPLPVKLLCGLTGLPRQALYPYLNFILVPRAGT
jgi:ubiquinone/menaquinone biosynthesis C-methylase UbiE